MSGTSSSSELVLAEAAVAGMACTSCKEGALRSEDSSSHEPATREGSWICSNCGTELSPESEKLCHMIRVSCGEVASFRFMCEVCSQVKEKAEDLFQLASDKSGEHSNCHSLMSIRLLLLSSNSTQQSCHCYARI